MSEEKKTVEKPKEGENMKLFLLLCMLLVGTSAFAKNDKKLDVVLKDDNFFAVTSVFTERLLEDFNRKVMTYDGDELIVYIDSPGGSVFSVARMVSIMRSSEVKFTCVARFAASAAFTMFQACTNRYILYDGIIMQHNASGIFWDEFPRIETLYTAIKDIVTDMETQTAKRMKMEFKDFKVAINNNLWLSRITAPKYNAIDAVINTIKCEESLIKKTITKAERKCGWFSCSTTYKKYSACPLLTLPLPEPPKKDKPADDGWYDDEFYDGHPLYLPFDEKINTNIKNFMHIAPYTIKDKIMK